MIVFIPSAFLDSTTRTFVPTATDGSTVVETFLDFEVEGMGLLADEDLDLLPGLVGLHGSDDRVLVGLHGPFGRGDLLLVLLLHRRRLRHRGGAPEEHGRKHACENVTIHIFLLAISLHPACHPQARAISGTGAWARSKRRAASSQSAAARNASMYSARLVP